MHSFSQELPGRLSSELLSPHPHARYRRMSSSPSPGLLSATSQIAACSLHGQPTFSSLLACVRLPCGDSSLLPLLPHDCPGLWYLYLVTCAWYLTVTDCCLQAAGQCGGLDWTARSL